MQEAARKLMLQVVIFEREMEDGARNSTTRQRTEEPAKEVKYKNVIRPMLMDTCYLSKLSIRTWDDRTNGQNSKWTALFDKVKGGEITIIAKPMEEVVELFVKHDIIKILS